jgi:hypothetical protein
MLLKNDFQKSIPAITLNGYCYSSVNNHECHYDGGDCCGPDINTDWCWGDCYCRDGGAEIINASMSIFFRYRHISSTYIAFGYLFPSSHIFVFCFFVFWSLYLRDFLSSFFLSCPSCLAKCKQ